MAGSCHLLWTMVIVLKRKVKSVLGYFTSQRVVDIVITSAIVDAHEHEHGQHGAPLHVHVCQGDLQLRLRGLLQRDANQAYNHMQYFYSTIEKGLKIDQAHTHSQTKTKIMHHRTARL